MEWTPGNHREIREEIKERCNRLKNFNKDWRTKVVPGEPGNPNYQIEVSHYKCKKFIKTNYDLFMTIPLDDEPADPGSGEKKGKKRTRGYQNIDYRDIMKDIESKIISAYETAYDALQESDSS